MREFKRCHLKKINDLSVCSDNESFISSDSRSVNLWNFNQTTVAHNLVQTSQINDLITHAEFHQSDPSLFMYSSAAGYFDYCDLRVSTQVKKSAIRFDHPIKEGIFDAIKSRVSSCTFNQNEPHLVYSRDYKSVSIWDIRSNNCPVSNLEVTDYLDDAEIIDASKKANDAFPLHFSPVSCLLLTGAYRRSCHVLDLDN